jgi:2-amino-4-hydroxy-6-hydroxymethyldihydropteridine diphosphokinase
MSRMMIPAFIGVGSRDGDRLGAMRKALTWLRPPNPIIQEVSWVYETEPVGLAPDRPLLNGVVAVLSPLHADELMRLLLRIEAAMGRVRGEGPPDQGHRPIDLDLLLLGDEIHDSPGLIVPHPRMHERRFVLQPLVDVAPEVWHPLLKRSARELLEQCGDTAWIRRHAPPEAWLSAPGGAAR